METVGSSRFGVQGFRVTDLGLRSVKVGSALQPKLKAPSPKATSQP